MLFLVVRLNMSVDCCKHIPLEVSSSINWHEIPLIQPEAYIINSHCPDLQIRFRVTMSFACSAVIVCTSQVQHCH